MTLPISYTVSRPMRIGVPKETAEGERRVALVPDVVRRLKARRSRGRDRARRGRRRRASPDEAFTEAGAELGDPWGAEVIARVAPAEPGGLTERPRPDRLPGAADQRRRASSAIAATGATAFAMEAIPRISRAQSMDALSSQATVSGYLSVIIAAGEMPRFLPMLMTAAGTIPPAQVLVLGAGVAGLQAIATARRLGAVVTAFDVRSAVKEQIQSLGAKFFEVEGLGDAEGSGGYARELTPEEQEAQRQALTVQMGKSDVIITTALVPGRPAPKLISRRGRARA